MAPCAHVLHSQCSSFVQKRAKLLGRADIKCPLCQHAVHNITPLFLSEDWVDGEEEVPADDSAVQLVSLDPAAMLTRVFHYQRRCIMHQRKVAELQKGLQDVQRVLATHHQRRTTLQNSLGAYTPSHLTRHSQSDDFVRRVSWIALRELAVEDVRRIETLRDKVTSLRAKNDVSVNTIAHMKHLIREFRAQGVRLPDSIDPEEAVPVPPVPTPVPMPSPNIAEIVDVDASSSDDEVAEVHRPSVVEEDDDTNLPPLYPQARQRASNQMPTVGVSTGRSLRDLPRSDDVKFQHDIAKWSSLR
jgi:hypothetical protein